MWFSLLKSLFGELVVKNILSKKTKKTRRSSDNLNLNSRFKVAWKRRKM